VDRREVEFRQHAAVSFPMGQIIVFCLGQLKPTFVTSYKSEREFHLVLFF
jgi:hypothetical protein